MMQTSFAIRIQPIAARLVAATLLLGVCGWLAWAAVANFIVSTLADERATINRDTLAAAVVIFPDSARLQARLAASAATERDFAAAENHAARALELAPRNYRFRLLMASIKESG